MSVQVSYKKQFMIFLLLSLIIVFTAEIILHVLPQEINCNFIESKLFENINDKEKICNEYTQLEYSYDSSIKELVEKKGDFININSNGFRGGEINYNHNQKIIFVGGSTMFGQVTTSDTTTIPGYTKKFLNEEYDIEILNAGIPSASSIDEIYLLEKKILPLKPKVVIMYDGWNDIEYANSLKNTITYDKFKQNDFFTNNELSNIDDSRIKPKLKNFFNSINFKIGLGIIQTYDNLYEVIISKQISEESNEINRTQLTKIHKNLFRNWEYACDLGQRNDFEVLIILQPMLNSGNRQIHTDELHILNDSRILVTDYLNSIDINNFDSCSNVYDFREIFDEYDELLFFDIGHTTDYGYSIVAKKISEILIENEFLD